MTSATGVATGAPVQVRRELTLIEACPHCGRSTRVVRDVTGAPVRLGARHPHGEWVAVVVPGGWRVVRHTRGLVIRGHAARYTTHTCPPPSKPPAQPAQKPASGPGPVSRGDATTGPCAGCCGRLVRCYGAGADPLCGDCRAVLAAWRAAPAPRPPLTYGRVGEDGCYRMPVPRTHPAPPPWEPGLAAGPVLRPPGPGDGLQGGPACPRRRELPQSSPRGGTPAGRMCVRCGRVTARRDGDGRAWCGGAHVAGLPPVGVATAGTGDADTEHPPPDRACLEQAIRVASDGSVRTPNP